MELIINASSSAGNSYLLRTSKGTLALEAGVPLKSILLINDLGIDDLIGCLVTHEHGDHAKYVSGYVSMGVDVYASAGTLDALHYTSHRLNVLTPNKEVTIGEFKILPFLVKHDAKEPLGFLINHPESGNILFLTDTWFCPYKFRNLNHMIVEANYDENILNDNLFQGVVHQKVYNRVKESHMELQVLKRMLRENDLSQVHNIVLIHLSGQNSDATKFHREITELTGKNVHIASRGKVIDFNITPF